MLCDRFLDKKRAPMMLKPANSIIGLLISFILISYADAACSISSGCGGNSGDWDSSARAFLNSDIPGSFIQSNSQNVAVRAEVPNGKGAKSAASKNNNSTAKDNMSSPAITSGKFVNGDMLKPLLGVSTSDLVIDVSNSDQYSKQPHIEDAIQLPCKRFLYENGTLRPISELAKALGDAGISREDSVVVYEDSKALRNATFVLWIFLYMGQDDAKILDGSLSDWIATGLPIETQVSTRKPVKYEPKIRTNLLADYEYVSSGEAQLVDVRSFQEYALKPLRSLIRIDPTMVLDSNGRFRDPSQLNDIFSKLRADRVVAAYSDDGLEASIIWCALRLSGFDSRLYAWKDKPPQLPSPASEGNTTKLGSSGIEPIDTSNYKKLGR